MTQPTLPSAPYQRAKQLLAILLNNGSHNQASRAITDAVALQLPRIEDAIAAGDMVVARGFLKTLNDELADLEVALNNQAAKSIDVVFWASELVTQLRALRNNMQANAI